MLCLVVSGGEGALPSSASIWPQRALGAGLMESLLEGPTLGPRASSFAWETHRCTPPNTSPTLQTYLGL